MEKINVFWHRRDLRYQDNVGLYYGLDDNFPVLPIFIFDKKILQELKEEDARVTFIHDCIKGLDETYRNSGSGLLVYHETPEQAFRELLKDYQVNAVYTNRDYEPYAKQRDQLVGDLLNDYGVQFYTFKDQVIFEQGEILTGSGEPYKVFTPYKNKWMNKLTPQHMKPISSELKLRHLAQLNIPPIPKLASLGFQRSSLEVPSPKVDSKVLKAYAQKRNFPAEEGTTRISVHLRFGTVSIREVVALGMKFSQSWLNELVWREFYMMILGHFPEVVDQSFKKMYDRIKWINDQGQFQKWCDGKTGYPMVDAGMRELNATGFMHNRVRMITASFLTKHLLIDWRWGEHYFAEKLLDYELSSNNGGWQWAAGTGTDAQPYFRVFNPSSQQEKFDKDFEYIKKWIPEYGTVNYPDPIVPHKEARERAIETYKEALS